MFIHVSQTKAGRAHAADWLFQMNKQAHLVDFTPRRHEYAKEGKFATVCQIRAPKTMQMAKCGVIHRS